MNESFFSTTDLHLAGYLIVQPKIQFKGLQSLNGRKKSFLFVPRIRCQKLAVDYMSGTAQMSVRRFTDGIRMAKDVLFGSERGEVSLR